MSKRSNHSFRKRIVIDIAGFGLIIASPLLGWLPGPGGIPVFLAGVAILSRNYDWAGNLLNDFEKRRLEFVKKYLVSNRKVSLIIDSACILIAGLGVYIFTASQTIIFKGLAVGLLSLSLFILISNQRRIDRLLNRLRKFKHKH